MYLLQGRLDQQCCSGKELSSIAAIWALSLTVNCLTPVGFWSIQGFLLRLIETLLQVCWSCMVSFIQWEYSIYAPSENLPGQCLGWLVIVVEVRDDIKIQQLLDRDLRQALLFRTSCGAKPQRFFKTRPSSSLVLSQISATCTLK